MPGPKTKEELDALAINNFREYLRIPSVQPNVDYTDCIKFLNQQASEIGLEFNVHEIVPKKPIALLTWVGKNPTLKSILLNSHMDVVPVFPEEWKHAPFGAQMDAMGNIYARGAQDMKCVGIQYLEAIRRLKGSGQRFEKTIHLSFVPDEEIGGYDGMKKFVHTEAFEKLNVGFVMDEGIACPESHFLVFYGERTIWQIEFVISGTEGHGSLLLMNTAGEKMRKFIDLVMDYRQTQVDRLTSNPNLTVGDVTTVNITMLKGGVEPNVLPLNLSVIIDFRVAVDVDLTEFEEQLKKWMEKAGGGITMKFIQRNDFVKPTDIGETNPYWMAMKKQFERMNITYRTHIFPAATDCRYCRKIGIPAINFSPMNNTPVKLHASDEFLNKNIFLKGIDIYSELISEMANLAC